MEKTKFGLPKKVIHCKECLLTNQKPFSINESKSKKNSQKKGLLFNSNNVCFACEYNKKKNDIDWDSREDKLKSMLSKYRKNNLISNISTCVVHIIYLLNLFFCLLFSKQT